MKRAADYHAFAPAESGDRCSTCDKGRHARVHRRPARGYSKAFTPKNRSTARFYLLSDIPADLWISARAHARREGKSMRALLLGFLTTYTTATERTEDR